MAPIVDVQSLVKVYEPTPWWMRLLVRSSLDKPVIAVDSVSFTATAGQLLTFIGPNGAGKSTIFRILTGLISPTSGAVRVCGLDPLSQGTEVRKLIGFMPADERTLFLRHTCVENLEFHGKLQGMGRRTRRHRIDEVLEFVGLAHARNRAGFALSSGMKARLLLARAVLHQPRVLILDEPTGTLDPIAAYELLERIKLIAREEKVTTLISSHRVEEIEALRDNIVLLDKGKVVYEGSLKAVREAMEQPPIRIVFETNDAAMDAKDRLDSELRVVQEHGNQLLVEHCGATGDLLGRLGDSLAHVVSAEKEVLPFHQLLRQLLARSADSTGEENAQG